MCPIGMDSSCSMGAMVELARREGTAARKSRWACAAERFVWRSAYSGESCNRSAVSLVPLTAARAKGGMHGVGGSDELLE